MIELFAPAKLTWSLEITGTRPDGFHDIRSEMVTLAFGDRLVIDEGDYLRVTPGSLPVALDRTNLITRALELVGRTAGVTLDKVIPSGGGLGGGSADAGAILRWAGAVSTQQALTLGADVPFCQQGGRALVEGVGEKLTPLTYEARSVTLLLAPYRVDTAACYRAFDALLAKGWVPEGRNHLEAPAGVVEPKVLRALEWARSLYGNGVTLAGSGSSMFLEGHLRDDLQQWDAESPVGSFRFCQTTTTP